MGPGCGSISVQCCQENARCFSYVYGHHCLWNCGYIWTAWCTEDDLKAFLDENLKMKELWNSSIQMWWICLGCVYRCWSHMHCATIHGKWWSTVVHQETQRVTECDDTDKVHVHPINSICCMCVLKHPSSSCDQYFHCVNICILICFTE